MFSIGDGIISVGNEEIRDVISGYDNVIISFGKASGTNRVADYLGGRI